MKALGGFKMTPYAELTWASNFRLCGRFRQLDFCKTLRNKESFCVFDLHFG